MKDEAKIESEIKEKGLDAPRLTPELIDAAIASEEYRVLGGKLTVCCITLRNGFVVAGQSSTVSPVNFDAELGKKLARADARNNIWELEGYLLQQRMYERDAIGELAPQSETNQGSTWQERLVIERDELKEKIHNARSFAMSDDCPVNSFIIIAKQAQIMTGYLDVLNERIDSL